MSFRSVFLALVIGFSLILAGFLVNRSRPRAEVDRPSAESVKATGKCAECHARRQYSVVHEFELSRHARENVNCLDCHGPAEGQAKTDHHGFVIATSLSAANCRACHEGVYQQYLRSRHAAPSWASVYGREAAQGAPALSAEQVAFSERFHPGGADRPPHPLTGLEGGPATAAGCVSCHAVGRPNADGTIGSCTACHTRHTSSVEVARLPTTCGQCHMGPDHSQLEIYDESKHGVMFQAQRHLLDLAVDPDSLSTRDMFVPTCATCHMSGLNGLDVTHDPSERLSYNLFAEVSDRRPNYARGQAAMKDLCRNCHTQTTIDRVYSQAEAVVADTNAKVKEAKAIMEALRKEGLLTGRPFETPLDFLYFDLWHYYGRTAKHGAFMGGADFVQWHGNYPLLQHSVELKHQAEALRKGQGHGRAGE